MTAAGAPDRDDGAYWTRRQEEEDEPLRAVGYRSKSRAFNRWMYRARWRTAGRVVEAVVEERGPDVRVLDAGSGSGFYVELWRHRAPGAEVVGVDVSADAIARLRARFPHQRFQVAELGSEPELPVEGDFDVVEAHDVLYHITGDGRFLTALRTLAGRVRPGGLLLVTDNFPSEDVTTRPHVRLRSLETYRSGLPGFTLEALVPQFVVLNVPSGIAAAWLRWPLVVGWEALTWLARFETVGWILGAALYGLDRLLLGAVGRRSPSTKLAVFRREAG